MHWIGKRCNMENFIFDFQTWNVVLSLNRPIQTTMPLWAFNINYVEIFDMKHNPVLFSAYSGRRGLLYYEINAVLIYLNQATSTILIKQCLWGNVLRLRFLVFSYESQQGKQIFNNNKIQCYCFFSTTNDCTGGWISLYLHIGRKYYALLMQVWLQVWWKTVRIKLSWKILCSIKRYYTFFSCTVKPTFAKNWMILAFFFIHICPFVVQPGDRKIKNVYIWFIVKY